MLDSPHKIQFIYYIYLTLHILSPKQKRAINCVVMSFQSLNKTDKSIHISF